MTRTPLWRRAAAALAVGALALAGGATAAQAAPTIDFSTTGTLYVHKRLNPQGSLLPGDGLPAVNPPGEALADVDFVVQKIDKIDLRWTHDWDYVRTLAADPSRIEQSWLLSPVTQMTDAAGVAMFSNLEIGAYLVTEKLTPEQVASGLAPAAPFVVTVPMTHPVDLDEWLYDVHVYPKNLQSSVTKTVDDGPRQTYHVGDTIGWTLESRTPVQPTTKFVFKDALVEHLELFEGRVSVVLRGTELEPGTDFTVDADALADDNTLVVRLTDDGLAKLNAYPGNGYIMLMFSTTVVSLPEDGIITNKGAIFPNEGVSETGPGVETPEVTSRFGEIRIVKTDMDDGTLLAGAEFKVFKSDEDAEAYQADPVGQAHRALEAYANGTGELTTTFTTGADGTVRITGLRASNWQDGVYLHGEHDFQHYVVLETKAPDGYELASMTFRGIDVLYDPADPAEMPHADLEIPNAGKAQLPLTGGQIATGVFGLLGALVLAGGVLLVVRARRQGAGA